MFHFVVIVAALICKIQGQIPVEGKCPEVSVQQNFDLNKYLGKWYEYANYPNSFEVPGKCYDAEYTMSNGTVKIHNSQIIEASGKKGSIDGTARLAGTSTEGKFLVNFPVKGKTTEAPYWVLGTDYDSYTVVWSCVEMELKQKLTSLRFLWFLTRARSPSADVVTKMYDVLEKSKISKDKLKTSNQQNCTD